MSISLVSVEERLRWRDALAHHIIDSMPVPGWKKQELINPINLTIACLAAAGVTEPAAIVARVRGKANR